MCDLTSGGNNVAIGLYPGAKLTTGGDNIHIGRCAGCANTTGGNNISIGRGAGIGVVGTAANVNIGPEANETGGSKGCISVCMYAPSPGFQTSDCRFKCDIADSDLGLSFIKSLKPRKFKYRLPTAQLDSDGNEIIGPDPGAIQAQGETEYGLIAQEVETALVSAGKGTNPHLEFGGYADEELEKGKTVGTQAEADADPDNVFYPGHHEYDPDHPDGVAYQKTKGLSLNQFISPIIKAIQELEVRVASLE